MPGVNVEVRMRFVEAVVDEIERPVEVLQLQSACEACKSLTDCGLARRCLIEGDGDDE